MPNVLRPLALVMSLSAIAGCTANDEPYKPIPAWSGPRANVPAPPALPTTPIKQGSSYTVYGAIHQLRSQFHAKDVTSEDISITGYIVDTNIATAPDCAIHPQGKADPLDCTNVPIPSFYVADNKGDMKGQKIRVMGWARNFAVVYDAMKAYKDAKTPPKELVKDDVLSIDVPFPLPAVGAKVQITGRYDVAGHMVSSTVSDPQSGIFMLKKVEYLEPPTAPAEFAKKLSAYPGK